MFKFFKSLLFWQDIPLKKVRSEIRELEKELEWIENMPFEWKSSVDSQRALGIIADIASLKRLEIELTGKKKGR
ncbi:hypothetical protein COV24_03020 [candidate division WWE3 bacterium CG10_big_fil_rev_8_21_14_0_10_32_10]|uniref:Uncharacterized protein n=1 Tax=candidate division WWE3 bacterium CG10_big_fil_rev_8_21_14_0_10_32_10 TaxID=1975090 RepID=A0A2H0RA31_UNCKA|nr:MAG: hypothetical protein COV24_03020 [candidate division WWE3 bacterium CG10_big_fil_rev_8_21_14_0_10_32_10]